MNLEVGEPCIHATYTRCLSHIFPQIGATPSVDNCKMLLKEMPIEKCSVTAAWRSRGCLEDAIIVQPNGTNVGGGVGSIRGINGELGVFREVKPLPAVASPSQESLTDHASMEQPVAKVSEVCS